MVGDIDDVSRFDNAIGYGEEDIEDDPDDGREDDIDRFDDGIVNVVEGDRKKKKDDLQLKAKVFSMDGADEHIEKELNAWLEGSNSDDSVNVFSIQASVGSGDKLVFLYYDAYEPEK